MVAGLLEIRSDPRPYALACALGDSGLPEPLKEPLLRSDAAPRQLARENPVLLPAGRKPPLFRVTDVIRRR